MSLVETAIDEKSEQALTFKRLTSVKDAEGNRTQVETTIALVNGDIQPVGGSLMEGASGSAENEGPITHLCFVRTRVAVALQTGKDLIFSASGVKYLIVFIHDFEGVPQEFDLRRLSDAG